MTSVEQPIEKFLSIYPSPSTNRTYRKMIEKFFDYVDGDEVTYFEDERKYQDDVRTFITSLTHLSKQSITMHVSVLKNFFAMNELELPSSFWKMMNRVAKSGKGKTMDRIPTNDELKRIISHMSICGKALYHLLASSGIRIGESVQLKLKDVDLESNPPTIYLRSNYTKSKEGRITFLSREAKMAIEEWLKQRNHYIKMTRRRDVVKGTLDPNTKLIFPFTVYSARHYWTLAIKKAQLDDKDPNTGRYELHPHVLRKRFRTKLGGVDGVPIDVVEAMMGHQGYLTSVYRRNSKDELSKFYLKGEHALLVESDMKDLMMVKEDVDKQRLMNESLLMDNIDSKRRVEDLETKLTKVIDLIQYIQKDGDSLDADDVDWRNIDISSL